MDIVIIDEYSWLVCSYHFTMSDTKERESKVILVTGGSGLVGKGIEAVVNEEADQHLNEEWVFLRSSDGDLREREETRAIFEKYRFPPPPPPPLYPNQPTNPNGDILGQST